MLTRIARASVAFGLLACIAQVCGCGSYTGQLANRVTFANPFSRQNISSQKLEPALAKGLAAVKEYEQKGNTRKAIDACFKLSREYPESAAVYHRLAVLHDKAGKFDQSSRYYLAAKTLDPDNAEILCDYGYSRFVQGDLLLAERTLRRAIQVDEELARAHNNLGLILAQQGKREESLASFRRAGCTDEEAASNLRYAGVSRGNARNSSDSKATDSSKNIDDPSLL